MALGMPVVPEEKQMRKGAEKGRGSKGGGCLGDEERRKEERLSVFRICRTGAGGGKWRKRGMETQHWKDGHKFMRLRTREAILGRRDVVLPL